MPTVEITVSCLSEKGRSFYGHYQWFHAGNNKKMDLKEIKPGDKLVVTYERAASGAQFIKSYTKINKEEVNGKA